MRTPKALVVLLWTIIPFCQPVPHENSEQPAYTNLHSADEFNTALTELIDHVSARYNSAQKYISSQVQMQ